MEIGALYPPAYTPPVAAPQQRDISDGGRSEAQQPASARPRAATASEQFSEEELRQVQDLKARDREVRAHEQAHAAAAGSLARGGPSFSRQRGPDGRWYAVGGEVQIDTSAVPGDPHATLQKALQIQRAALAPASPSAQDRAVAANAAAMAAEARMEIASEANSGAASAEGEQSAETQTGEPASDAQAGRCPACGAHHGASARNEALSQHFANTVTPQKALGKLFSAVV